MADNEMTSVNTVAESEYLSDFIEGERVNREQIFFSGYRRSLDGPMMPGVEDEGSWINSRHNPANGGRSPK